MSFPAPSPTKETSGVAFSVTSRRSLDCERPTTGSDEGNSSRDFRMNRLAVHHFRYRAPTISREVHRAIAEQIVSQGGDYVLAVKGNQESLHQSVIEFVDAHVSDDFKGTGARRHVVEEQKHGRTERRFYIQFPVPDDLKGRDRWASLRTIGVVVYESESPGKKHRTEIRYFISSLRMGVKQFAKAVRSHWGIENTCHWSLDMTYREDELRTRHRHLAENLAWLRRFTLSLLKQHSGKQSLVMKRRLCGWNEDFLLQVLLAQAT